MDKIYSPKFSNLIIRDRYLLVIDNKGNRKLCNINSEKIKIAKKEINIKFFENMQINTFWAVDTVPYEQITHKEFFEGNGKIII
jgi:hypothetical protein